MSRKLCGVTVLALALVLPTARLQARSYEPYTGRQWLGKYQSASECIRCHTRPTAQDVETSLDFVLLTEYSIWKTHDKHAQAYAVLRGPRGRRMGELLGQDVTAQATGCMNCHAMSNLFGSRKEKDIDGVSCGGCHGPSQDWNALHNNPTHPELWRLLSPEEKAAKGFRDLRDPEIKASLCLTCHVGNADEGKVVTHAMYAAGHPPLPPIEIATFTRNEPQHWRDSRDVPYFQQALKDPGKNHNQKVIDTYHLRTLAGQRTQLALVGGVAALRATVALAGDRANFKAADPARMWPELLVGEGAPQAEDGDGLRRLAAERWPEIAMTHSDCYACHHELRYPGYRQERGFGYRLPGGPLIRTAPGRPILRDWPLALLTPALSVSGQPQQLRTLESDLRDLAATCSAQPFGEPKDIIQNAQALKDWCATATSSLQDPAHYGWDSRRRLLLFLCGIYGPRAGAAAGSPPTSLPDYETARELASVLHVVYDEATPRASRSKEAEQVLAELTRELDLQPYIKRSDRLQVILKLVMQITKNRDARVREDMEKFTAYLGDIGNPDLLATLPRNSFLREIQEGVSNERFTQGLLEPAVIDELQKFSNEELRAQLQAMNEYDPRTFLAHLDQLARILGAEK